MDRWRRAPSSPRAPGAEGNGADSSDQQAPAAAAAPAAARLPLQTRQRRERSPALLPSLQARQARLQRAELAALPGQSGQLGLGLRWRERRETLTPRPKHTHARAHPPQGRQPRRRRRMVPSARKAGRPDFVREPRGACRRRRRRRLGGAWPPTRPACDPASVQPPAAGSREGGRCGADPSPGESGAEGGGGGRSGGGGERRALRLPLRRAPWCVCASKGGKSAESRSEVDADEPAASLKLLAPSREGASNCRPPVTPASGSPDLTRKACHLARAVASSALSGAHVCQARGRGARPTG